jgi:hypothetical protein
VSTSLRLPSLAAEAEVAAAAVQTQVAKTLAAEAEALAELSIFARCQLFPVKLLRFLLALPDHLAQAGLEQEQEVRAEQVVQLNYLPGHRDGRFDLLEETAEPLALDLLGSAALDLLEALADLEVSGSTDTIGQAGKLETPTRQTL